MPEPLPRLSESAVDDFLGDGPCARKGEAPAVRGDLYGTRAEWPERQPMLFPRRFPNFATRRELMAADVDVIAALRLAVEATEDWETLGQVTKAILEEARATPENNTGGVELLVAMQRSGALRFEVESNAV